MRILVQRVTRGAVSIAGKEVASIGAGLVLLLGVGKGDTQAIAQKLAKKTASLRIFADAGGKLNLSLKDIGGEALVVSQFTLYADTSRGNRPGFELTAPPELAVSLYEYFVEALRAEGIVVQTGVFQAHMLVSIENDGPVTLMLES
ncbi:MAG: D-aminoacyl-tRNA deacylase [Clostridiales bacterium]|nr:D-aminoacyl-tRNA deacylase [Clostridiales bacterium]